MKRIIEKQKAQQATGIVEWESGLGTIYNSGGDPISIEQAKEIVRNGGCIEIPNAGAGSYKDVFVDTLGFEELKVIDWTSSAGDWSFGVKDGDTWYWAGQSNRYPNHGFEYQINPHWPNDSFETLTQSI